MPVDAGQIEFGDFLLLEEIDGLGFVSVPSIQSTDNFKVSVTGKLQFRVTLQENSRFSSVGAEEQASLDHFAPLDKLIDFIVKGGRTDSSGPVIVVVEGIQGLLKGE